MGIVCSTSKTASVRDAVKSGKLWIRGQEGDESSEDRANNSNVHDFELISAELCSSSNYPILKMKRPSKSSRFLEFEGDVIPPTFIPSPTYESFYLSVSLNDPFPNIKLVFHQYNQDIMSASDDTLAPNDTNHQKNGTGLYIISSKNIDTLIKILSSPYDQKPDYDESISRIWNYDVWKGEGSDSISSNDLSLKSDILGKDWPSEEARIISCEWSFPSVFDDEADSDQLIYICVSEVDSINNSWKPIAAFAISTRYTTFKPNLADVTAAFRYTPDEPLPESLVDFHCSSTGNSATISLSPQGICSPQDGKFLDDGPLFRATLSTLEKRTTVMKKQTKTILTQAKNVYENMVNFEQAQNSLFRTIMRNEDIDLKEFAKFKTLSSKIYSVCSSVNQERIRLLKERLVLPLENLYANQIKVAELKKREFAEESKIYYQFLQRYLADQRSDKRKDEKFQLRKKQFELKRFDYLNFINDLNGERGKFELLHRLFDFCKGYSELYSHAAKLFETPYAEIQVLSSLVEEFATKFKAQKQLENDQRKQMEIADNNPSGSIPCLVEEGNDYSIIRQSEDNHDLSHSHVHKEGILLASSHPTAVNDTNKPSIPLQQTWHKYWVVLSEGKLCEYVNWKTALELHNEPILLKACTVREARKADRRFCFEILTPQIQRVYQCTSNEDLQSWIKAIQSAISKTLMTDWYTDNTTSCIEDSVPFVGDDNGQPLISAVVKDQKSLKQALGLKLSSIKPMKTLLTGPSTASNNSNITSHSHAAPTAASNANSLNSSRMIFHKLAASSPTSTTAALAESLNLLSMLRETDAANKVCADCSSSEAVEWVSITHCTIICINCAGIHRSLGTQISKVRSLILDTVSFTPSMIRLLQLMTNSKSNQILEAMVTDKITVDATAEERSQFINSKYKEHRFTLNPDYSQQKCLQNLVQSIENNDVQGVYRHITHSLDLNSIVPNTSITLFEKSLEYFEEVSSETVMSLKLSDEINIKVYPISELLYVNGADVTKLSKSDFDDQSTLYYVQGKLDRISEINSNLQSLIIPQNTKSNEKDKRLSARIGMKLSFRS